MHYTYFIVYILFLKPLLLYGLFSNLISQDSLWLLNSGDARDGCAKGFASEACFGLWISSTMWSCEVVTIADRKFRRR